MVTMQERRTRKEMQVLRTQVLLEQTAVRERYCNKCPLRESSVKETCESCPATPLLAECGERLLEISAAIRAEKKEKAIAQLKEYGLTKETYSKAESAGLNGVEIAKVLGVNKNWVYEWKSHNGLDKDFFEMEVAEYDMYRKQGLSDLEIAKLKNAEIHHVSNWKKRNNKCGRPNRSKRFLMYRLEIDGELIARGTLPEVAEQSGFSESTLRQYRRKSYKESKGAKKRKVDLIIEGDK